MKTQLFDRTVIKFLAAGVVNTLVGCGTMFLLYNLAHCSYWASSAANYVVGGIVSFFLNKYFTFQNKTWEWSQVWKFAVNVTVCYLLGYGLAKPLVRWALAGMGTTVQDNAAMLAGMCLFVAFNYCGQRFFVFKKPEDGAKK